ncbi:hypothetical protein CH63R_09850 [Colletotrichum higginsianum IMI 349063]|uniref:Uncharacterized protein n=1 Tax=Colletotrichum higginsianum (strain IMI 349063) TaxID=759273 RepID=A0A1B7Y146_COLHI|nr:uncharacterized protein CH63R_09850 [Colletotrichum higginsianum IMI 349063]OBR05730.1 hypothetical protein CH63R_09850 [Colletotrichum higginsianum IMI 349063]
MPDAKKATTERPPAPVTDRRPKREIPADIIDTNPFSLDMSQGITRGAMPPFTLGRSPLAPRHPARIAAEPSRDRVNQKPDHVPLRPATPTPYRRPRTPEPHPESPPSAFRTPESSSSSSSRRTVTRLRVVEMETSPATSGSGSGSKPSLDTEGDVRMRNGVWGSPEAARLRQREEVRAMVTQSVHDNFEFERARFADEIRTQLLATVAEDVRWLVRENFEAALAGALGRPAEGEAVAVQLVRERLGRLSNGALARVFCTPEMLEVLRRMVCAVDLEMRTEAWSLVEADESWQGW